MEKEYNRSPQEVLEELGSCPTGLTEAEAAERLAKHGPNKLKEAEKPSLLQRFLTQLKDPMLLILMAAAAVSAVTNALSGESFTEVSFRFAGSKSMPAAALSTHTRSSLAISWRTLAQASSLSGSDPISQECVQPNTALTL